ncbi:Calcium-transporting ATPase type 2C member 1 [Vespula maculifrons]|uniref:Calcium-transporting ATPase type 2C member 1 n=1 Tax=Vespula maculifrons TaxID=7453 RepID=A0ABD2C5W3_VESMC
MTFNMIDEMECTIITDTKRTLPSDFWPSNWWKTLQNFLLNGGLRKLRKNTEAGILRLVSPLNGKTGPIMIAFKPEDGPRASYAYQQRFGFRGCRLIELLGTGFNSYQQGIKQPLLAFSLTPPLPSSWRTFSRDASSEII